MGQVILLGLLLLHTILSRLQAVLLLHAWLLWHALWDKAAAGLRDPSMQGMQAGGLLWHLVCRGAQALRMLPGCLLHPVLHLQDHWGLRLGQACALLLPKAGLLLQVGAQP